MPINVPKLVLFLSIFITDRVRNPVDDLIKDIISARLNNQKSYLKYPYGLNDKLDNEDPTKSVLLQMKNNITSKKKRYRTKIPRSKHKSRPDAIKYITECHRMFALDKSKARKLIFNEIITAPNTWIKKLSIFITDRVRNPVDDLIKDINSARLNNQKSVSKRRTKELKF